MEHTKTTDYEGKFSRMSFMIKDLFERYNNILHINNGNASEHLSTYKTIIKNQLHEDLTRIKNWVDNRYFSKDNTPLGTYMDKQMTQLEDILENGDSNDTKQTTLKKILLDICESLEKNNIESKFVYAG